jgi:hypothetical protein
MREETEITEPAMKAKLEQRKSKPPKKTKKIHNLKAPILHPERQATKSISCRVLHH